jgi:hypothetical protein
MMTQWRSGSRRGVAGAYEGGRCTGGGSVSGQVKFAGTAPALPSSRSRRTKSVRQGEDEARSVVSSGGGLANAAVVVKATKEGAHVPTEPVEFDQKGCEYHPHVLAFPAGSTVRVLNPDGVLHNVHMSAR